MEKPKQEYPKMIYRQTDDPKRLQSTVVHSKEEHEGAGSEWKESPADFDIETHPGVNDQEKAEQEKIKDLPVPEQKPLKKGKKNQ